MLPLKLAQFCFLIILLNTYPRLPSGEVTRTYSPPPMNEHLSAACPAKSRDSGEPVEWVGGLLSAVVFSREEAGEGSLVTLELHYREAAAGEVFLVWSLNDGALKPQDIRPISRVIKKEGTNLKQMDRQTDTFTAKLQAPANTPILFGFWITKDHQGNSLEPVWDGQENYQLTLAENQTLEITSDILSRQSHLLANGAEIRLITQEIRYRLPETAQVTLVWGIDGWQPVPEEIYPPGTVLEGKVMQTPMTPKDETFIVKIQVPAGAILQYGFLIIKKQDGSDIKKVWDGSEDYQIRLVEDGVIEVVPKLILDQSQSTSGATDVPFVTQEIRYRLPEAGEVMLVWGINNWQLLPEEIRPARTVIKGNVMHTPMISEGDIFVSNVQVPVAASLEYGFLITKDQVGKKIKPIWNRLRGFQTIVKSSNEPIEIIATVNLPQPDLSATIKEELTEEEIIVTPTPIKDQNQNQQIIERETVNTVSWLETIEQNLGLSWFNFLLLAVVCSIFILIWVTRESSIN